MSDKFKTTPRQSWTFDEYTTFRNRDAETGIYDTRGGGSKRKLPHFDDFTFFRSLMLVAFHHGYIEDEI